MPKMEFSTRREKSFVKLFRAISNANMFLRSSTHTLLYAITLFRNRLLTLTSPRKTKEVTACVSQGNNRSRREHDPASQTSQTIALRYNTADSIMVSLFHFHSLICLLLWRFDSPRSTKMLRELCFRGAYILLALFP